jgi:hypothetical protein
MLLAVPATLAAVRTQLVTLPNPSVLVRPPPPLSPQTFAGEVRLPKRIASSERIFVGLTRAGAPSSVRVVQRLSVRGAGDYAFAVPAPATEVRPGPGTATPPGLRTNQIVWQGFSPGRRLLVADADLRLTAAATALPLRIQVETTIGGKPLVPGGRASGPLTVVLTVRSAPRIPVDVFAGDANAADAAAVLDELREAVDRGRPAVYQVVRVRGRVEPRRALVSAPFRLLGKLRFAAGTVRVTRVRNDAGAAAPARHGARFAGAVGGSARALHITVRGIALRASAPRLRIVARPAEPDVDPPGRTWAEAVRRGRIHLDGRALLARAIDLDLAYERSLRYLTFLANPDPIGQSSAVYVFATSRHTAASESTAVSSGGGTDLLLIAGVAVGAVALLGAAVVLWAHL